MRAFIKKNLLGLPVETKSGMNLGKLMDVELDVDSHLALNYHVQASQILPGFLSKKIIVGRHQVVAITAEKIVVEDNIVKELAPSAWEKLVSGSGAPSVTSSAEGGNLAVEKE